jgi:hypothetical protein
MAGFEGSSVFLVKRTGPTEAITHLCMMISTLRQQFAQVWGNAGDSAFTEKESGSVQHADSQQVEAGTSVHLPFQSFQPVDVTFGLTIAPG